MNNKELVVRIFFHFTAIVDQTLASLLSCYTYHDVLHNPTHPFHIYLPYHYTISTNLCLRLPARQSLSTLGICYTSALSALSARQSPCVDIIPQRFCNFKQMFAFVFKLSKKHRYSSYPCFYISVIGSVIEPAADLLCLHHIDKSPWIRL